MLKAVVFDLDGTVTRPCLDFARLREEMGLEPEGGTILEQLERLRPEERTEKLAILERHERRAAERAELNFGFRELASFLAARGIKTAVFTRNSEACARLTLARLGLRFHRVITRDSGYPLKPSPAALLDLAREWKIEPSSMLMAGDYRLDVECGKAAGCLTCFITNARDSFDHAGADFVVKHPGEIIDIIKGLHPLPAAPKPAGAGGVS